MENREQRLNELLYTLILYANHRMITARLQLPEGSWAPVTIDAGEIVKNFIEDYPMMFKDMLESE